MLLAALIAGCTNPAEEAQIPARPVRVFRVAEAPAGHPASYAGEVQARYETQLSFRVPGKIVSRQVEVGDRVRKRQLLAQLDPTDYELAAKSLAAQLAAARSERDFAREDLARYRELLEQNVISRAEYDRRETAYRTARDRVEALRAQLDQANNQIAYTQLHADRAGAVTSLAVETGQVVAAGQSVVSVAQLDEKEVVVDIPEHRIADVRSGLDVTVTLWVDGERPLKGRIREIAPSADPASRTYRVKVALPEGEDIAQLGMTATVHVPERSSDRLAVPLPAVFQSQSDPSHARVWLVDEAKHIVRSIPVRMGEPVDGQGIRIEGLTPGQLIVSAGTNRLVEGQAVRLPQAEPIETAANPKASPSPAAGLAEN
ncbi:MAG: efflux RND transporter periplasmic adaptor subunit [Pseudomonadota bacterium]